MRSGRREPAQQEGNVMRFVTAAIGRVLAIAGLVTGVTAPSPAPAQPAEIRFASVGGITDAPLYLAEELGLFAKAGISVKRQRMNNAPTLLTAIATDQLDVAGISVTPGLFTSVQQGVQIRIVGDKQSLRPGFSATRLVIRSDLAKGSEAETVAALKGKSVAVSAKASQVYMLLVKLLR
jgi:NitT/TauT family transport system substrate-binding protein